MATFQQSRDETREYKVVLKHETGETLQYTADDALTAKLWIGDDQPTIGNPTCSWITAPNLVKVRITSADLSSAPIGKLQLRIYLGTGVNTRRVAEGVLIVLQAPGAGQALKTYCSSEDLRRLYSKVDSLQDRDEDQTGFVEQRNLARQWIEGLILDLLVSRGERARVKTLFDADGLVLSDQLRQATAHYSLARIFESKISAAAKVETDYSRLSGFHQLKAFQFCVGAVIEVQESGSIRKLGQLIGTKASYT